MLHELLFALSGIPGGTFRAKDKYGLEVVKNLPYLHPSEIEALTHLCKLGAHFRRFTVFIEEQHSSRWISNQDSTVSSSQLSSGGLYITAFSDALETVLNPYRTLLIDLEQKILKDPHLTLSHVQNDLQEYFFLFPALGNIIDEIDGKQLHGCQILNTIYDASMSGIPIVKASMERILFICHGIFFKQVTCWMLYGLLADDLNEFFVKCNNIAKEGTAQMRRKESAGPDRVTDSSQADDIAKNRLKSTSSEESDDRGKTAGFSDGLLLVPNMIPDYIPSRLAEKIFFVGRSVKTFSKDTSRSTMKNEKTAILQGRELEFLASLNSIRTQDNFSARRLETEVDKVKAFATEQLWRLIVLDGKLLQHLKHVKEMFLLGRGELFLTFIDQCQASIKTARSGTLSYDLNSAFHQCIGKLLTNSDEYEAMFSLSMEKADNNDDVTSGWSLLRLAYNPPWPLHIVFTNDILVRYNELFRFLLSVKRTQLALQHIWAMQMSSKHENSPTMARTWNLRRQMAFFIDNLQYYLQVDVLDAQFSILCRKIDNTKDFETIQIAHDVFLSSLTVQSFLSMKSVYAVVVKLLDVCQLFCDIVSLGQSTERERRKVEECSTEFERRSSLLFKIISSVHTHQVSPHLAQLLLRIDFNKFFTINTENSLLASV